ncbi:mechanosensitive ion channel family protein [Congregibacter litoralis]|uniref:Small-conductance mechanosensitive channel n=1 Tax=Congregibacter litoralis KT71 TaxID=314285 RepID=A4A8N5_9GAMM|nr:mechanosensitive ion channel domain-containing protein [Congregibacter litoralis]EAQ97427.2 Small-conductance mechanosensitive channel [Congregibacter litoralis KT71]
MPRYLLALIACCFLSLSVSNPLFAQDDSAESEESKAVVETPAEEPAPEAEADAGTMREILESEKRAEEVIREKVAELEGNEELPRTPLQLIVLMADASGRKDWEQAASYLDMRYLPEDMADWTALDLMDALRVLWNQQNIIDITSMSDEPEGKLDDGLPPYRDLVGMIRRDNGEEVPIYLQRIPDGAGGKIWKISNASVAEIPSLWQDLGYGPVAVWLERHLPDYRFAGLESWQLITGIVFLVAAWYIAMLASYLLMRIALLVPNRFPLGIESFFQGSLRFFLFLVIFRLLMDQLALSLAARVYLNSSGVGYIAFTILLLGVISLIRDYNIRRLERAGNRQYVALLKPFTTIVKIVAMLIVALVWAERAGYNMSTIIAGLGVGSLAVALAAQKTLENVIGAITLYSARPVNPGDLCRFGNIVGVVEEIGLRSTMIRTLNRTMLAVPNAVFSSVEVENFSHRDRIRYYQHIELQMTTADQLRVILGRLRELFLSHADAMQETVSVRLEKVAAATAVIRIDVGIRTTDYQRFLAVAEDLNLRMIELVHDAGAIFSGPGQVLQLRDFYRASDDTLADVKSQLENWKGEEKLPFPDYTAAEKAALQGAIELPNREDKS